MTVARKGRGLELAICLSVMLHLLLFLAVRSTNGDALTGVPVPPETRYIAKSLGNVPTAGSDVRTLWSPILFSLPSELGFSRELLNENLRTRLTFSKPVRSENFLEINSAPGGTEPQVAPEELMVTASAVAPQLPNNTFQKVENRLAARRVYVAPELKERLVGGVVLPSELNEGTATAWEVRADVSISKQGTVRHVFLDRPLDSPALNSQVLKLLYGLRFSPGFGAVEGSIEIYSPEANPAGGSTP